MELQARLVLGNAVLRNIWGNHQAMIQVQKVFDLLSERFVKCLLVSVLFRENGSGLPVQHWVEVGEIVACLSILLQSSTLLRKRLMVIALMSCSLTRNC